MQYQSGKRKREWDEMRWDERKIANHFKAFQAWPVPARNYAITRRAKETHSHSGLRHWFYFRIQIWLCVKNYEMFVDIIIHLFGRLLSTSTCCCLLFGYCCRYYCCLLILRVFVTASKIFRQYHCWIVTAIPKADVIWLCDERAWLKIQNSCGFCRLITTIIATITTNIYAMCPLVRLLPLNLSIWPAVE